MPDRRRDEPDHAGDDEDEAELDSATPYCLAIGREQGRQATMIGTASISMPRNSSATTTIIMNIAGSLVKRDQMSASVCVTRL